jgi:polyhydroxybutyrate depolymerase
MKRFLTLLALAAALLAACHGAPAPGQKYPAPVSPAAAQPLQTSTPTPPGTWKMVIEGVIHDTATGGPIAGASIRYKVVHSYFPEIQAGWPNTAVGDQQGRFSLPMIVHDTDNIHIVVEAPGYMPYEKKLDLLGDRKFSIGLTALGCAAGTYDQEMFSGGQTRSYRLHVPANIQPGKPVPLVLGFHGAGGSGVDFEARSGFSTLADQAGFIVVYPQGLGSDISNWDTMPNSQDVPFVRDLLDLLDKRCSIDPQRVFATGISRGGGMVNRLGCELADRIAAIGPISGDYAYSENCAPARPVAVVAFHGTLDPTIPYNGFGLPGEMHEAYNRIGTPITTWAAAWGERNGCQAKPAIVFQQGSVSAQEWSGCRAGATVIFYTLNGGKHEWPVAIDAAKTIWDFFTRHPSL